jgi:hypothetical protein
MFWTICSAPVSFPSPLPNMGSDAKTVVTQYAIFFAFMM